MSNAFLSSTHSYRVAAPPETAFLRAKQEWDLQHGASTVRAKNWRLAFFASSALCLLLALTVFIQVKERKVIPILVGLDKERGEPVLIGPAESAQLKVGSLEVKYFLSQFIRFTRSVPSDEVMIKQNWLRAYAFLRSEAAGLLNEMTNKDADSPLKKIGQVVVSVQPLSVVEIPNTNSYQVRWRETVYSTHGTKLQEYSMLAVFTVEIDAPRDEKSLLENPLGLYIKTFQWNKEL